MRNISITIVYDNNPYKAGLKTAWGFSCLVKVIEKTILFDTGGDGFLLLRNMKSLTIDPTEISLIFLSHIHNDHVGGLWNIIENNNKVTVCVPKSFPESFKNEVKGHGIKIIEIQRPVKICDNVYSTGELGVLIKEQSLIIHTYEGLILITGCAHPGIVNIVNKAKDIFKEDIFLLLGGFHLSGKSKDELEKIVYSLKKAGVRNVGPCHCSGDAARAVFKEKYQMNYINVGVGQIIDIRYR
ncbi:MAG: MBL fold metallo-hydrolase [Nitrospirae bacterium]|nr:MBL fold metallo-hydrolase [Nitrospirota bacterium]